MTTTARETMPTYGVLHMVNVENYRTYNGLIRVVAYVLRFINLCRGTKKTHRALTTENLNTATIHIIRHEQHKQFPDIIKYLTLQDKPTDSKPTLKRQLDLNLDKSQLLRCGNRLSNASQSDCEIPLCTAIEEPSHKPHFTERAR